MTLPTFGDLSELGLAAVWAFLFLSLLIAAEVGYHIGPLTHPGRQTKGDDLSAVSTLTAGMFGLLALNSNSPPPPQTLMSPRSWHGRMPCRRIYGKPRKLLRTAPRTR